MVVSSKKKKGKQRKAAVLAAAANNGSGGSNKVVAKVMSGDNKVTKKLLTPEGMASLSLISYEHSGVLSVVLDFLNRCEHETFEGIMASIGGDLKTPSTWIDLLQSSYHELICSLQIAKNIGPLVKCMCNDTERKFFKSNKHWRESIAAFVRLVLDMISVSISSNDTNIIVDTLLQYEGLLTSIVQWGFWKDHRPDIQRELKNEDATLIFNMSREATILLLNDASEDEGIERLAAIGSAPIINKRYDATSISYVSKSIQYTMIKDLGTNELRSCLTTILILIDEADCVDKEVITKLIVSGASITCDYESVRYVAKASLGTLIPQSRTNPSDTRVAFAIRSGLIEMCLGFIERFDSGGVFDGFNLLKSIEQMFMLIYEISLHQKTAKAIRSKRQQIEDKLVCLEQNTNITKPLSRKLLSMLRSVLDISGRFCCQCNKSLSKTEVMECNSCHRMAYCSRACQREDWLYGHSVTCCKSYIDEKLGQFQGRLHPIVTPKDSRAAAQLEELEKNITMIQLKLFLDNSDTILRQASILDIPLHDCIVKFDLRECPLWIETKCHTKLHDTSDQAKRFEETRSKENVTCTFCSYFYSGDVKDVLIMQRFFPHEWLMNS